MASLGGGGGCKAAGAGRGAPKPAQIFFKNFKIAQFHAVSGLERQMWITSNFKVTLLT